MHGASSDLALDGARPKRLVVLAFACAIAVSAWVRIDDLGARGISHPEFYASRIELPAHVKHPHPRVEFADMLRSVHERSDIHPPGFYVLSWLWNGAFGTSLVAMRSLSVLAGLAAVAGLFALCLRRDGLLVAAFAALLLGMNGLHVAESTTARIWVWPATLAILSLILLERLRVQASSAAAVAYVAALALGMWTEYSFAFVLGAQGLYELVMRTDAKRVPYTLQLQVLAITLSLPILVYLEGDLRVGATAYLGTRSSDVILDWLRLGFLGGSDSWRSAPPAIGRVAGWLALASGLFLLARGVVIGKPREASNSETTPVGLLGRVATAAIGAGLALMLYVAEVASRGRAALIALAAIGVVLALPLLDRAWPFVATICARVRRWVPAALTDPLGWHAVVPMAAMLAVNAAKEIIEPRVVLATLPFVMAMLARGTVARLSRPIAALGMLAILVVGANSAYAAHTRPQLGADYGGVAEIVRARKSPGDWIVFPYDWYSAPLYFYFKAPADQLVLTRELEDRLGQSSPEHIWLINFPGGKHADSFEQLRKQLANYELVEELGADRLGVQHLRKATPNAAAPAGELLAPMTSGQESELP